jgi:two-component system, chemotaxis family, chemotaxis protein CheY
VIRSSSCDREFEYGHTGLTLRVRITKSVQADVDGIDLSRFIEGLSYDVGTTLGNYLLAQGWAEPVNDDQPAAVLALNRTIHRSGILVVEDDSDMRTILTHLLEFHGWNTVSAGDGIEGLAQLQKHRPALILLDLAMPRMDGVQFRKAQRQLADTRLATVPCVVVSAVHDAPSYRASLNAADVLTKPFEADRLLKAVESYARPVSLFR